METNIYTKFCANVFAAKCNNKHEKGEVIILTTKHGQKHENEVHNFLGKSRDGYFIYSITRCDGFNAQKRAIKKTEMLQGYASNAFKRSEEAYNSRASKTELEFMRLGEPIKIGHHSENRHRKLYEKYDNKMRKSIEEREKALQYNKRAEYWEGKADNVNLSMPESLEFYKFKLEEAKKKHQYLKDNPNAREHSLSLTYSKKSVNEAVKNLNLAVTLWGSDEDVNQLSNEKKEEAETQAENTKSKKDFISENGGFFAFNNEQFKEGYKKILELGYIEEGEKVTHIKAGLYIPSKNVKEFIKNL